MSNQKNRFWTFCLSLVPGAGEMYFGMYRCGVSLMLTFALLLVLPIALNIGELALLDVVLWFYSFLHTHNLRSMPPEAFMCLEDRYFWERLMPWGDAVTIKWDRKLRRGLAIVLILMGSYLVLQNLYFILSGLFPWVDGLLSALWSLPRLAVGVLIIALGLWLISGKKRELEQEQQQRQEAETTYTDIPVFAPYETDFSHPAAEKPAPQADGAAEEPAPQADDETEEEHHEDA